MNKLENEQGRAFIFGDNIDTDQILPGYAMSEPEDQLKKFAMKGSYISDFAELVQSGDVVIGGDNFGCGSSREQAPVALKNSGVSVVIAKSLARIFRKNSINIGLPVIVGDLTDKVNHGDLLEVDIEKAIVVNKTKNETYSLQKLSETTLETLRAGGLINKVRNILLEKGEK